MRASYVSGTRMSQAIGAALTPYDERLDRLPILRLDELDGKSAWYVAHHATDDLSDREHGPDPGHDVRRDCGPADRDVDDETGHDRSVREREERKGALGDKTHMRAIVG